VISARLVRHRPAACTRLGLEIAVVSFRGEQKQDLTEAIEEQLSAAFEAAGIDAAGQGPVLEVRLTTDCSVGVLWLRHPTACLTGCHAGARLVLDREANFC
jgi:hypothetical protein